VATLLTIENALAARGPYVVQAWATRTRKVKANRVKQLFYLFSLTRTHDCHG